MRIHGTVFFAVRLDTSLDILVGDYSTFDTHVRRAPFRCSSISLFNLYTRTDTLFSFEQSIQRKFPHDIKDKDDNDGPDGTEPDDGQNPESENHQYRRKSECGKQHQTAQSVETRYLVEIDDFRIEKEREPHPHRRNEIKQRYGQQIPAGKKHEIREYEAKKDAGDRRHKYRRTHQFWNQNGTG
jgi:hypothetical protein